ncbi:MAG: DUF4404 family protein [Pseudomonadota bacterium]|nr:hypothetical protein [Pseudomonadales bacterium]MDY6919456.1 DUF4404 family protein [Pseudomonadota bacterium]
MPKEKLQNSVTELKEHLESNEAVTSEDKVALQELTARLEMMMNGSTEHWEEGLMDELEKQVIQYEEAHPVIARVFNQIINTLNSMGL